MDSNQKKKIILLCVFLGLGVAAFFGFLKPNQLRHVPENSPESQTRISGGDKDNEASQANLAKQEHNSRPPKENTHPPAPKLYRPLFNVNGRLTEYSIKEIGLDESEVPKVQAEIDGVLGDFEATTASKAVLNAAQSDPDKGIYVYNIPSFGAESQNILDKFKGKLRKIVDSGKSELILHMLMGGGSEPELYGGLGKYDVRIKFHPSLVAGNDERVATFSYCDPKTGNQVMSSERTVEKFKELFGNSFELEK